MSLLGKILLFVNLLAGAGAVYLGLQDFKGRQTITASGFRHELLIVGMPLSDGKDDVALPTDPESEIPFYLEGPGGSVTKSVSPAILKAYFANAGGGSGAPDSVTFGSNTPVTTQLAEVKRVQALIKGGIDKDTSAAVAWLQFQPETFEERTELKGLPAPEQAKRLYARFDRVLGTPKLPDTTSLAAPKGDETETPEQTKARLDKAAEARAAAVKDETERRARLAHLLVHLDRDPAWQKRVMMVVGMRRYVKAVGDQAARFREMTLRVDRGIVDDQDRFLAQYALLRGLAIERTNMVRDMAEVRARLEEQKRKDEEFVAQRKTQLAQLTAQLQKVKAEVDALIAKQTEVEASIFAVQREVALTLEDIYRLQEELTRREKEVYANPKK